MVLANKAKPAKLCTTELDWAEIASFALIIIHREAQKLDDSGGTCTELVHKQICVVHLCCVTMATTNAANGNRCVCVCVM